MDANKDILEALYLATSSLERADDWQAPVNSILEKIRAAIGVDRIYVFSVKPTDTGDVTVTPRFERVAVGVKPELNNPDVSEVRLREAGFGRWLEAFQDRREVSGLVHDFPESERGILEAQKVLAILIVPIFVQGQLWGFLGVDECTDARRWSASEIFMIRTVASAMGTAINRIDLQQRLAVRRKVGYLSARRDELTGLFNRRLFFDAAESFMARYRDLALVYLNLNQFDLLNQRYTKATADALLAVVAGRLKQACEGDWVLARVGVDEFCVAIHSVPEPDAVMSFARSFHAVFRNPFLVADQVIPLTARIGYAARGSTGQSAHDLFTAAVGAANSGEARANTLPIAFAQQAQDSASADHDLAIALAAAMLSGTIHAKFQPIVRLGDCCVIAAEALCRWLHPERGDIPPVVFIPVAEAHGLIVELGLLMIAAACKELQHNHDTLGQLLSISVNLSARQLDDQTFIPRLSDVLAQYRFKRSQLRLEITETEALQELESLEPLRALGVSLSIDDYGTGFSSLAMFRAVRADCVKLDRVFVKNLAEDPFDQAIVRSTVTMAGELDIDVIAEGVETPMQVDLLLELGCKHGQGFLYSPAIASDQFRLFTEQSWANSVERCH